MANPIGPIITTVLQRVRDPQGTASSRDFVRKILSHAQRILNSELADAVETIDLITQPGLMFYDLSGFIPNSMNVVEVEYEFQTLPRTDLNQLRGTDPNWSRTRGSQYNAYAQVGKNLLILYPALSVQSTVTVRFVKDTGILQNESEEISLLNDHLPLLDAVAEAVLLLKQRDLPEAKKRLDMFSNEFVEITGG